MYFQLGSPGSFNLAQPTPPRLPQVMFEFDVHYGFRDAVDLKVGQFVPIGDRLTAHRKRNIHCYIKYGLLLLQQPVPQWVENKCPKMI